MSLPSMKIVLVGLLAARLHSRLVVGEHIESDGSCFAEDDSGCLLQSQVIKHGAAKASLTTDYPPGDMSLDKVYVVKVNDKFSWHGVKWSEAVATNRAHQHARMNSVCNGTGGRAWLSTMGLNHIVAAAFPAVLIAAETTVIEPVSGVNWNISWELSNIRVSNISFLNPPSIKFAAGLGLQVDLTGISFNIDVSYTVQSLALEALRINGSIHVPILDGTSLSGLIQTGINAVGKPVLSLSIDTFTVELGEVQFPDGLIGWLAQAITNVMSDFIVDMLAPAMISPIESVVNVVVNDAIEAFDFRIPLTLPEPFDNLAIDLTVCDFDVAANYMAADFHATVISTQNADAHYPGAPTPLPNVPPQHYEERMASMDITNYGVNTGLNSLFHLGLLQAVIYTVQNPSTESETRALLSDVGRKMSSTGGLSITARALSAPSVSFSSPAGISAHVDLRIGVNMTDGSLNNEIIALRVPAHLKVHLGLTGGSPQALSISVNHFQAEQVIIISGDIHVNMWRLKHFINELAATNLMPMLNNLLKDLDFTLGTYNGVTPKDTTMRFGAGWVGAMTNFTIDTSQIFNLVEKHVSSRRPAIAA